MFTGFMRIFFLLLFAGITMCMAANNIVVKFNIKNAISLDPIPYVKVIVYGRDIVCDPCGPSFEWKLDKDLWIDSNLVSDTLLSDLRGNVEFEIDQDGFMATYLSCAIYDAKYFSPLRRDILNVYDLSKDTTLELEGVLLYPIETGFEVNATITEFDDESSKLGNAKVYLSESCMVPTFSGPLSSDCTVMSDISDNLGKVKFDSIHPWGSFSLTAAKEGYFPSGRIRFKPSIDTTLEINVGLVPYEKGSLVKGRITGTRKNGTEIIPISNAKITINQYGASGF